MSLFFGFVFVHNDNGVRFNRFCAIAPRLHNTVFLTAPVPRHTYRSVSLPICSYSTCSAGATRSARALCKRRGKGTASVVWCAGQEREGCRRIGLCDLKTTQVSKGRKSDYLRSILSARSRTALFARARAPGFLSPPHPVAADLIDDIEVSR